MCQRSWAAVVVCIVFVDPDATVARGDSGEELMARQTTPRGLTWGLTRSTESSVNSHALSKRRPSQAAGRGARQVHTHAVPELGAHLGQSKKGSIRTAPLVSLGHGYLHSCRGPALLPVAVLQHLECPSSIFWTPKNCYPSMGQVHFHLA